MEEREQNSGEAARKPEEKSVGRVLRKPKGPNMQTKFREATVFLQYLGNLNLKLKEKLRKLCSVNFFPTTMKFRLMPGPTRCKSPSVGQTCRRLTSRINENQTLNSTVGQHDSNMNLACAHSNLLLVGI